MQAPGYKMFLFLPPQHRLAIPPRADNAASSNTQYSTFEVLDCVDYNMNLT